MPSRASATAAMNPALASTLRCRYQSSPASISSHASEWRRYGLLSAILSDIEETGGEAATHVLAGYHFDFARSNIIDPALDLFVPSLLNSFFRGPFIETLDQVID